MRSFSLVALRGSRPAVSTFQHHQRRQPRPLCGLRLVLSTEKLETLSDSDGKSSTVLILQCSAQSILRVYNPVELGAST